MRKTGVGYFLALGQMQRVKRGSEEARENEIIQLASGNQLFDQFLKKIFRQDTRERKIFWGGGRGKG